MDDQLAAKFLKYPIDVLAWSWGAGDYRGENTIQDVSLTTYQGGEAPFIAKLVAEGAPIKKAVFTAKSEVCNITMTLENVVISSISTGGSGGEERFTQNISIRFESMTYKFEELKDGHSVGTTEAVVKAPSKAS